MLNELILVRNGLAEIDPDRPSPIHKELSEPGKQNLLRVVLAPQGSNEIIADLDYLQGDKNKKYWTQGSNQDRFPTVKLNFPLRLGGVKAYQQWKHDNKRPSPKSHLQYLADLRSRYPVDLSGWSSWPKCRNKLKERAEVYSNGLHGDAVIVADLLRIFLQVEENGLAILRELDEKIWRQCERNADKAFLDLAALIMFARLGENQRLTTKGEMPTRPTLLFDYARDDGCYTAADKHWRADISSVLFNLNAEGESHLGTCALSGEQDVALVKDTFPEEKCEHLGTVKIFSRKKETPTFQRYGKKAAESMAVSARLADDLTSALHYLNDKDKKGKTWDVVPGETGNGDLLLSFCQALPDVQATRLLAYEHDPSLDDEDDYEREAEEICNLWQGEDTTLIPQVDFVIIRKVSKGIQKAIFSSSQSLAELENSAKSWCQASKNVPDIELLLPKSKEKERRFCPPFAISPKRFAFLFNKQYSRAAELKSVRVPGLPFAEVMVLFLNRHNSKEMAERLLNRLLKQQGGLLERAALKQTNPVKHHGDALCAITAMGLLLHKLARLKEDYMSDFYYKLGQFCAVLDEIHIGYCESERDGQLPNRLIGNQAYATAVNHPIKALEITAQRTAVYQAWAQKNSKKTDAEINKNDKLNDQARKAIINAKYAFFWLKEHSEELRALIPESFNQATATSKAELLLGYLAGREIPKKTANQEQDKQQQGEPTDAN